MESRVGWGRVGWGGVGCDREGHGLGEHQACGARRDDGSSHLRVVRLGFRV